MFIFQPLLIFEQQHHRLYLHDTFFEIWIDHDHVPCRYLMSYDMTLELMIPEISIFESKYRKAMKFQFHTKFWQNIISLIRKYSYD